MAGTTDKELEVQYDNLITRVNQERSDFLLPQVLDFVNKKSWLNLHPEYQRRLVWDEKKRSKFIESLLMNLPIPPVFLYEFEYGRYEVIDGQQRLSAIVDFYSNRFKLKGLEIWSGINKRNYSELPPKLKRGLDRRRISAVVILAENSVVAEEQGEIDVRKLMFERLNTGGQNLQNQELRNCLYAGNFNDLLINLAGEPLFNDIWGVPRYEDNIRGGQISKELAENSLFQRMRDVEIVLRFFAFRKKSNIRGAVKKILDRCMADNENLSNEECKLLGERFMSCLNICHEIFGERTFMLPERDGKAPRLSQPLYDALMLAVDKLFDRKSEIVTARQHINRVLYSNLEEGNDFYELIVGRANTAQGIKDRLSEVENIFSAAIS